MSYFEKGNRHAVAFIHELALKDCPDEVPVQAKTCLLDLIGAALAGGRSNGAEILLGFISDQFRDLPEASIIGAGRKTSCLGAALVNGFIANALDIDDGHRPSKGHPGSVVFPAVLAAAEMTGADGTAFLEALIVGYEVTIRAAAIMHRHYGYFHGSGAWGAVGAAAATARLLNLNPQQTFSALGIAESYAPMTPVMRSVTAPAMAPKDGVPWGAMSGLGAALLARRGYTGSPSLLGDPEYNADVFTLGSKWRITQLYFKPYPCCRWAQPSIDAVLNISRHAGLKHRDISRIVIHTFSESASLCQDIPRDWESAEYNIRYPVAVAAVHGDFSPMHLTDDCFQDRDVLRVLEKIETIVDPDIQARFPQTCQSRIEIHTQNGTVHDSGLIQARGDWEGNPLTGEELETKFRKLVHGFLTDNEADRLIGIVRNFENHRTGDLIPFF